MDIDLIFKIASIGIIVAILNQLLMKTEKGEYAFLTTLAGIIAVFLMIIPGLRDLFEDIRGILDF